MVLAGLIVGADYLTPPSSAQDGYDYDSDEYGDYDEGDDGPGDDSSEDEDTEYESGDDADDSESSGGLSSLDISRELSVEEVEEQEPLYKFSLLGENDPFVPKILLVHFQDSAKFVQQAEEFPDTPLLLKHPLESYQLKGIWSVGLDTKGLIITPPPENRGIVVEIGDLLGDKNGKIIEINKDGLIVRESFTDEELQRKINDRTLSLFDPLESQSGGES